MKIVHLISGAGPMYCGSCLHGNTLVSALSKLGEDVLLAPLYTPLRTDEENLGIDRLALGGINVYLQESSRLARWMPRFVARWLDRPALVEWVARRGSRTRPAKLGSLTVATLRGPDGPLRGEVERLVAWLADEVQPGIIHLSNVMLAGLARPLRERLGVPVVCTLSGEDGFLEKLPPPWHSRAREELRARAADITAMVAMNRYYARFMTEYLAVAPDRIRIIPPGLSLTGHRRPGETVVQNSDTTSPRTIGYFGRVCEDKGVHLLVDACRHLASDSTLPPFRLRAAGYLDVADLPYLDRLHARLAEHGLRDRFEYVGELDRAGKIAFLQSLDVLSLPSILPESKGLPVLEAWANGVPVVLPSHGTFTEMIEETGGGLLHAPCQSQGLAGCLARMLREPEFAADCGRRGQTAVYERFHAERMARDTLEMYHGLM